MKRRFKDDSFHPDEFFNISIAAINGSTIELNDICSFVIEDDGSLVIYAMYNTLLDHKGTLGPMREEKLLVLANGAWLSVERVES